jgi:hypothetical protein
MCRILSATSTTSTTTDVAEITSFIYVSYLAGDFSQPYSVVCVDFSVL